MTKREARESGKIGVFNILMNVFNNAETKIGSSSMLDSEAPSLISLIACVTFLLSGLNLNNPTSSTIN